MYADFGDTRRTPRLPGLPYHFISRVVRIDGRLNDCKPGMEIVAEYDIPEDAWYFDENGDDHDAVRGPAGGSVAAVRLGRHRGRVEHRRTRGPPVPQPRRDGHAARGDPAATPPPCAPTSR